MNKPLGDLSSMRTEHSEDASRSHRNGSEPLMWITCALKMEDSLQHKGIQLSCGLLAKLLVVTGEKKEKSLKSSFALTYCMMPAHTYKVLDFSFSFSYAHMHLSSKEEERSFRIYNFI